MIVFKCKEPIFDFEFTKHNTFCYYSATNEWSTVTCCPHKLEENPNFQMDEFDHNCWIVRPKNLPVKERWLRRKPTLEGEWITLADGQKWCFKTIKNVRRKFVLTKDESGDFIPGVEVFDPLFDELVTMSKTFANGVEFDDCLKLIVKCLSPNYLVTKNLLLYLGLLTSDNIKDVIEKIYAFDLIGQEANQDSEILFRTDELQTGESNSTGISVDDPIKTEATEE